MLLCFLRDTYVESVDQAVEMHGKIITQTFRRACNELDERIVARRRLTHEVLEDLERLLARRPPREPDEGDLVRQAKLVVRSSCRAYEPEILGRSRAFSAMNSREYWSILETQARLRTGRYLHRSSKHRLETS